MLLFLSMFLAMFQQEDEIEILYNSKILLLNKEDIVVGIIH